MPRGTNIEKKLRKLERLTRRAFHGLQSCKYADLAQSYRGSCGHIAVSNTTTRDILKTLDELDELRSQ
jgi:hypothetical protein